MREALKILVTFVIIIWLVEVINILSGRALVVYGILPRHLSGLSGILLHPFLHGSPSHLISNSLPLMILGFIVALEGRSKFIKVTLYIVIVGGALLWLLGRASLHIGASLLIFGYFGYIVVNAFHKGSFLSVFVALIAVASYGGIIYGVLPLDNRVSWEGHLFGLIAGIAAVKSVKQ